MNHAEAAQLMHAYVDDELDVANTVEVEQHLRGCRDCARAYRDLMSLREALGADALYRRAPRDVRQRLDSSLRQAARGAGASPSFGWRWAAAGAVLVVLALLALPFVRMLPAASSDSALADQVLASHVRSLMVAHLTDVTSSDQHTVKPWFDGKLDFAPDVEDLAAQGFPLIGGRLDYLGERPVAALVYQRRLHVINLFIWPGGGAGNAPQQQTRQGYHLFEWQQAGMLYWAVSDLSPDELQQFVTLIQQRPLVTPAP